VKSQLPQPVDPTGPRLAVPKLEPRHRPNAAPPPAPSRGQQCHEANPPAVFRITAGGAQLWRTRTASVGDFHPNDARLRCDRNRDRLAWIPRAAMANAVAEHLAHQQFGVTSARVPRTKHPAHERSGDTRPLRPPGKRHALPDRQPSHHRTRPSPAAPPRETGRAAGGRRDMHAHLSRERQAGATGSARTSSVARPWSRPPSVAVRETADGAHRPSWRHPRPSAIRPWTPQYDGLQRDKMTHHGTEKKRPA
jgi:hypothetical protein